MTIVRKFMSRKHIRLQNYDYSQNSAYYLTLCTEAKNHIFGSITNDEMMLNSAGHMFNDWLSEMCNKFPQVQIESLVIMPNHIHMILLLNHTQAESENKVDLPRCIQWFKTMTTNAYIQGVKADLYPPFDKRIWQRNYYEHVIRSEEDYKRVWTYIDENVLKWSLDEYYST